MPRRAKLRVTLKTRNDLNTFVFRAGKFKFTVWERPDALYEGTLDSPPWGAVEMHMSDVVRSVANRIAARQKDEGVLDMNSPLFWFFADVIGYLEDIER
jgi:hypothetical protein